MASPTCLLSWNILTFWEVRGGSRRITPWSSLRFRIGTTERFLVGPPAQKPLSALLLSNTGLVFCFLLFLCSFSFWAHLNLWKCIQCFSGSPGPLCGLPHKGAAADWEQCLWNGHLKSGLRPEMAELEQVQTPLNCFRDLSFLLRAEGPKKRNGWLQQLVCLFIFNSKRKCVLFSLIFLYLFPAKETVSRGLSCFRGWLEWVDRSCLLHFAMESHT